MKPEEIKAAKGVAELKGISELKIATDIEDADINIIVC